MQTIQHIDCANFTLHLTLTGSIVIKMLNMVPVNLPFKNTEERLVEQNESRAQN